MFVRYKKAEKTPGSEGGWLRDLLAWLSSLYTGLAFLAACSLLPAMLSIYAGGLVWKGGWRRWLERKYPGLEFVERSTPRTVIDTPRNQCIISLLLALPTLPQLPVIKNRVKEEILERGGDKPRFPHLKNLLTSRWGSYAWVRGSQRDFRLENHVLLAPPNFKGRPISDTNIQEVTSDLIAKLLPGEVPPWQILVLPTAEGRAYLLVRLHHLYLSEEGMTLGDLLHLGQATWESAPLLQGVFRPPVVIPRVYSALSESTSNMWNEIVSQYDPVEKPDVVKHPSLKSCFFLACIVGFASVKTYFSEENQTLQTVLETEMQKRCLSLALLTEGFFNTFSFGLIISLFSMTLKVPFEIMKLPLRFINLVLDTPTWPLTIEEDLVPQRLSALRQEEIYLYWLYLGHYVVQELIYLFKVFYKAPRVLFEELFLPERPANVHQLQTISFCGRKVVSWSEPIPRELIKQICFETGATENEVLLSGVAGSLRHYFLSAGFSLPENIMTTCHFTPRGQLPGAGHSGFLCLPLPMQPSEPVNSLEHTRERLLSAKESQTVLYLAGERGLDGRLLLGLLPGLIAKAALYLLSRRYALSVSLVQTDCSRLWGQPVHKLMYWSPPQANVCMSLTVMCYGDSVTLGVMADAQLCPHHVNIPAHFPRHIKALAASLRIPTD